MRSPNLSRWSDPASYLPHWSRRADLASTFIPDGVSILEVGAGNGSLRQLVHDKCEYTGYDLAPLDPTILPLNLDVDQLPDRGFDFAVLLGVIEYLHEPKLAVSKVCEAAQNVVCSYCCLPKRSKRRPAVNVDEMRFKAGWVNAFTLAQFIGLFQANGFTLQSKALYRESSYCDHMLFHFQRAT